MYQPYLDILDKLGEPQWWDENGVPRYVAFNPRECADIYNTFAALLEIRCQSCRKLFRVASTWGILDSLDDVQWDATGTIASPKSGFPKDGDSGFCRFGDAPWHPIDGQCSGTTMTTAVHRVVEFWDRRDVRGDGVRVPEYEVYVGEDREYEE